MASIKLKRGSGVPSGLTFGEPAFDITNSRLYVGVSGGSALIGVAGGGVHTFNGLTGAVTGVTTGTANTFGPLQTFTTGISAAGGSTFSSTTNTVNIIASTDGAGLRIARATTGANSRIGGIRLGMSTSGNNTYIENSAGSLSIYAASDNNTTNPAAVISNPSIVFGNSATTSLSIRSRSFSLGDNSAPAQFNAQQLVLDNDRRALYFGDITGVTEGNFLVNRAPSISFPVGITYAMEVNSKTGKNISLVFNDKTAGIAGSTAANVGLDVDSSGNFTINPSGTRTTINSLLNAPNGISASGGTFAGTQTFTNGATFSGLATFNSGISATGGITFNAPISSTRLPRTSSEVFETKTANFSPSNADNGKIFVVDNSSKTPVTVSLDSLSIGWRAKFISVNNGAVGFSSSIGTVYGIYGANGGNAQVSLLDPIVEVICYGTNLYFAG